MTEQPDMQYEDRAAVASFTPTALDSEPNDPKEVHEPEAMTMPTSPEVSEVVE
jgi:hypothetical protein